MRNSSFLRRIKVRLLMGFIAGLALFMLAMYFLFVGRESYAAIAWIAGVTTWFFTYFTVFSRSGYGMGVGV